MMCIHTHTHKHTGPQCASRWAASVLWEQWTCLCPSNGKSQRRNVGDLRQINNWSSIILHCTVLWCPLIVGIIWSVVKSLLLGYLQPMRHSTAPSGLWLGWCDRVHYQFPWKEEGGQGSVQLRTSELNLTPGVEQSLSHSEWNWEKETAASIKQDMCSGLRTECLIWISVLYKSISTI